MKDSDNIPKLQAYNKWNIFMSPFGAKYVTFWRKINIFMSPFGAKYVTFWRKVCHLLAQTKFITHSFLKSYVIKSFLINNLENNLINYSNKLFNKERGTSKKVLGLFGRPLSTCGSKVGYVLVLLQRIIINTDNYEYN